MKSTIIIGGGIVGLFTAYFLQQEGIEVKVIDRTDLKDNCSTGNAGMIVPSHIIPPRRTRYDCQGDFLDVFLQKPLLHPSPL